MLEFVHLVAGEPRRPSSRAKVMGRSTKDVDAALGKGARQPDGKWRYDIGDGEFVVVVYETQSGRRRGSDRTRGVVGLR